jgi:hypothetical protein
MGENTIDLVSERMTLKTSIEDFLVCIGVRFQFSANKLPWGFKHRNKFSKLGNQIGSHFLLSVNHSDVPK